MAEDWMSVESLSALRMANASWKLLASDDASFCCAFFYDVFLKEHKRNLPEEELVRTLKGYLYRRYDEDSRPDDARLEREAREALKKWANEDHQWLHRFYKDHATCYDLSTAAQKAVEWLSGLRGRQLIGTESRLHLFFHLLHEIEHEANPDKIARLQYLEEKKTAIEEEMAALKAGGEVRTLDEVQIRARFLEAMQMAQGILSDFREVKDQFQAIYEEFRKEMNEWEEGKGVLLERFLESRDLIEQSDQGKSFRAFFEYLMRSSEQAAFDQLVEQVLTLGKLSRIAKKADLKNIKGAWLDGAEDVQETLAKLSEQIAWYVNERHLEEKRQIYALVKEIEKKAAGVVGQLPKEKDFLTLPEAVPDIVLPMEKPLRMPPAAEELAGGKLEAGRSESAMDALFHQVYVDKKSLRRHIEILRDQYGKVTLADVIHAYPVKKGLLELLTYMEAAKEEKGRYIKGINDAIVYTALDGERRMLTMGRILFEKKTANGTDSPGRIRNGEQ